ncbi:decarboxylase [Leptothermofonsia sp. ETS-13]|uniref:decarboxylase n=1 Tax=Leptothermofonsia sp. ETS-13 TaxID=3035696 RepID=UPI003B9E8C8C
MVTPPSQQTRSSSLSLWLPPFPLSLAQELLSTYGSPLYVYQSDRLRQTIHQITRAIPYPHTQFQFATVTNGNLALLRIFREAGWGLHANTPGDAYLGLHAGFHPNQIVYSGSNLSRSDMEQLLHWNITTFNLDSLSQLQLFCEAYEEMRGKKEEERQESKVRSREAEGRGRNGEWIVGNRQVKTQNSKLIHSSTPPPLHPTPSLGLRLNDPTLTGDSRIGVRPEEFSEAIAIAHQAGLKLTGLHFYRGTGTNATKAFTQVIERVLAIAQTLPDWEYLDFGGGFGYPYHRGGVAFNWEEFGAELSNYLNRLKRPIRLVIEPGRAAIAGCAVLLTQVVSVKWQNEKQIVGTDTTVANLSVPSVHGGYREIVTWQEAEASNPDSLFPTDVSGNTTYSLAIIWAKTASYLRCRWEISLPFWMWVPMGTQ